MWNVQLVANISGMAFACFAMIGIYCVAADPSHGDNDHMRSILSWVNALDCYQFALMDAFWLFLGTRVGL